MDGNGNVFMAVLGKSESPKQITPGDADENGKLDLGDVILILQKLTGVR